MLLRSVLFTTFAARPFLRQMARHSSVMLVTLEIEEARVEKFLEVMKVDAEGSRAEKGCIRFDVLQDKDQANKFMLYEVYEDDAAVESHRKEPHYLAWQDFKKDGGVISQSVTKCNGIIT